MSEGNSKVRATGLKTKTGPGNLSPRDRLGEWRRIPVEPAGRQESAGRPTGVQKKTFLLLLRASKMFFRASWNVRLELEVTVVGLALSCTMAASMAD